MKIIYRGYFKKEKLPIADLPEHAVKFKEPSSQTKLYLVSSLFLVPSLLLVALFVHLKQIILGSATNELTSWGILAAVLAVVPHEFLHAICFKRASVVHVFLMAGGMCVCCTDPVSKARFIFMSLLPNLVFGVLPLIVWLFVPYSAFSNHLYTFGVISLLCGVGDYMNVFNALVQMPKGSIQQLSGFNSYWYRLEVK